MLTPRDIHEAEFKRVWKGYNPEEVDEFLTRIVGAYERVYQENAELRKQVEDLRKEVDKARKSEGIVAETLDVARAAADDLKMAARKEAEAHWREAQMHAEEMTTFARRKLESEVEMADRVRRQIIQMQEHIRRAVEAFFEDIDQFDAALQKEYAHMADVFSANRHAPSPDEDDDSTGHLPSVDDTAVSL